MLSKTRRTIYTDEGSKISVSSLLLEGLHTGDLFMVGQYVQPYPADNIITTL